MDDSSNPYQPPRLIDQENPQPTSGESSRRRPFVWLRAFVPFFLGIWCLEILRPWMLGFSMQSCVLTPDQMYFILAFIVAPGMAILPTVLLYGYLTLRCFGRRLFRPWVLFIAGMGYFVATNLGGLLVQTRSLEEGWVNVAFLILCVFIAAEIAIATSRSAVVEKPGGGSESSSNTRFSPSLAGDTRSK